MKIFHDSQIPHTLITDIVFWAMRLTTHSLALALFGMACLIFPRLVQHPMLDWVLNLVLPLGALPFLSRRRGLVALVILHLPSLWLSFLHTLILGPVWGPDPRHVNIGGTSYIPSHIPSSSTPIPSNSFLMTHPLPTSSGPSG